MSLLDQVTKEKLEQTELYASFPVGECIADIVGVEEITSKNGNEMLRIVFQNDKKAQIYYYIPQGDYFLRKLKALYTAFNIPFDEKNPDRFIGKRGIVVTKLDDGSFDGIQRVKVSHVRSIKPDTGTQEFNDDIPF